jgi:4-amino-4-deoxy-L-arabinose transferase-like glycosyltransferase
MKNRQHHIISGLIIGAGIALRLWSYYDGRTLFLDEANLALNIAELSYASFFSPIGYEQYAPPLYLCLVKLSTQALGMNEWALRLPSAIAGMLSLWLFWRILLKYIPTPLIRLYPLLLFACAPIFVRYSTELKQYSVDVCLSLALILLAGNWPVKYWNRKHYVYWAIIGIISVWLSMPIVFVLAGLGVYYAWQFYQARTFGRLKGLSLVIICWLISFALLYFNVLQPSLSEAHLLQHHQGHFFLARPLLADTYVQAGLILRGLFAPIVGYTALALIIGGILFVAGVFHLWKKDKALLLLLGLPVLLCFGASSFEQFSLMPRVSLFLLPLLLLLIGHGAHFLHSFINGRWSWLYLIALLLASEPIVKNVLQIGTDTEYEDIKTAIQWIKGREGTCYVHHEAIPAYRFYSEYYDQQEAYQLDAKLVSWNQHLAAILDEDKPSDFFLLHSHLLSDTSRGYAEDWLNMASAFGTQRENIMAKGAAAYWFEAP